jgi:hypothetical protein
MGGRIVKDDAAAIPYAARNREAVEEGRRA